MTDLIKAKRTLLAAIRNADIEGVRKSDLTVNSVSLDGEEEWVYHTTFRGEETVFTVGRNYEAMYEYAIPTGASEHSVANPAYDEITNEVEDEFHCDGCNETDPLFRSSLKNLCVNCHADS